MSVELYVRSNKEPTTADGSSTHAWLMTRHGSTFRLTLRAHPLGCDLESVQDGRVLKLQHFFTRDAAFSYAVDMQQRMIEQGWQIATDL